MFRWKLVTAMSLAAVASTAVAGEISLLSGVYQADSTEVNNDNKTGTTNIEVGGRFTSQIDATSAWFIESQVKSTKYDAPKGQVDRSDDNSIAAAGGYRWYFMPFADRIHPYAQARVGLKSEAFADNPTVTPASGTTPASVTAGAKHDKTSLFYAGDIGFHMDLSKSFFFDFELPLFESSIYGSEKVTSGQEPNSTQTKTSHFDLYVKSYGALSSMIVGIGFKF